MKLSIVTFQKNRNAEIETAKREYIKRLSRHAQVELSTVKSWDDRTELPSRLAKARRRIGPFLDRKMLS